MTLDYLFIRKLAMIGVPMSVVGATLVTGALLRRRRVPGAWLRGGLLTLVAWVAAVPIAMLSLFVLSAGESAYSACIWIWSDPGTSRSGATAISDAAWYSLGLILWGLCVAVGGRSWWCRGCRLTRVAATVVSAVSTASGPCLAIGCWLTHTRARNQMGSCGSNLRQLSLAIEYYRKDHDGRYPSVDGWREALRSFAADDVVCGCPGKPGTKYAYAPPEGEADPAEQPLIVCEHEYLHKAEVLFADGSVRSRSTPLVIEGAAQ